MIVHNNICLDTLEYCLHIRKNFCVREIFLCERNQEFCERIFQVDSFYDSYTFVIYIMNMSLWLRGQVNRKCSQLTSNPAGC